jgi:16S rRNA processing protein RimM
VVKAQGRIGEVAADLYTDFPERFEQRTMAYLLDPSGKRREAKIEQHWFHKGRVILKLAGVDSISDAEQLAGCELQVPREDRVPLDSDAVYVSELVGCRLFDHDHPVGEVADVVFGAGEAPLLLVRGGTDAGEGNAANEYMIPFAQAYLKSVDTAGKRIAMELPEGMLELDAPLNDEEKKRQHGKF